MTMQSFKTLLKFLQRFPGLNFPGDDRSAFVLHTGNHSGLGIHYSRRDSCFTLVKPAGVRHIAVSITYRYFCSLWPAMPPLVYTIIFYYLGFFAQARE